MRRDPGLAALLGVGPLLPHSMPSPVTRAFFFTPSKVGIKHLPSLVSH